jgi:hypothetical protein
MVMAARVPRLSYSWKHCFAFSYRGEQNPCQSNQTCRVRALSASKGKIAARVGWPISSMS